MNLNSVIGLDDINTFMSIFLFMAGLFCLITQRQIIKQVIGLRIMLQGVLLSFIQSGRLSGDLHFAEAIVISALVVEAVVISIAMTLILNIFRHYPTGDIDSLDKLKG
jgi:NADH:ubiquinone oxidoreductase subunit K